MEHLKANLELSGAQIKQYELTPNEQTGKGVLIVTAPLSAERAEVLGCRDMFFDEKGCARDFEGQVGIPVILKDTELHLAGEPYRPDTITKFKVGRDGDEETDATLYVTFRAHFTGHGNLGALFDFVLKKNKGEFTAVMEPLQGDLFQQKGGTPVALSDGTKKNGTPKSQTEGYMDAIKEAGAAARGENDTGCVACNNEIPMADGSTTTHASGAKCTRNQEGPALASAREVAGGTHQRKTRGPQPVN